MTLAKYDVSNTSVLCLGLLRISGIEIRLEELLLIIFSLVEMPYRTIQEVVISDRPTSLFLTLWEPPRIFLLASPGYNVDIMFQNLSINTTSGLPQSGERERLSKIPHDNADHGEVLGQSLIYCITVSPAEFTSKIERLKRENEYLEFSPHTVPIASVGCTYMAHGMASFKSTIAACSQTIPFEILYQFQALVQNGYLLPHTVQALLSRLQKNKSYSASQRNEHTEKSDSRTMLAQFPFSAPAVKSKNRRIFYFLL
jgi:hypothetical protein